jgi:hypothetical protein
MCTHLPLLGSAFATIGNPNGPLRLDFGLIFAAKALQAVRPCEYEGGVEGGVSNSSDDERGSADEEVSETREGVRETLEKDVLGPEGAKGVGGRVCGGRICAWGATLRGRGRVFLCLDRTDFDPGLSDVPVECCACVGGPY